MDSLKNPVSGDKHEAHMVLPTGFIFPRKVATTSVNMIAATASPSIQGNNAYYSEIEWSSENRVTQAWRGKFAPNRGTGCSRRSADVGDLA